MTRRTIAAIFLTYRQDGCKAVHVETNFWDEDECHEDALRRICQFIAPEASLKSSQMHHNGSSSWATYDVPPHLSHIFSEEIWQHPTVACAGVSSQLPTNIRTYMAKAQ